MKTKKQENPEEERTPLTLIRVNKNERELVKQACNEMSMSATALFRVAGLRYAKEILNKNQGVGAEIIAA